MKVSQKVNEEIFEARDKVKDAERDLERAEEALQAILKKYHFEDENEQDVSNLLPFNAYVSGMKLSVVETSEHKTEKMFLRDKEGNDLKVWNYNPSLTELFEECNQINK